MRKQFIFNKSGKELDTLGFSGTIKQMFVNQHRKIDPSLKRTVEALADTKIDMEISGMKILDDYYGSPVDEFNILTEEYQVGDMTQIEVNIDGPAGPDKILEDPVIITFIYELPIKQKRTDLR